MLYKKTNNIIGKWAKASELTAVKKAKIISETTPQPSQFLNKDGSPKTQDVCRVQFEGITEPLNVALNRATLNGLIDAFGENSEKWQGHTLSVETEKVRVAGKSVIALYLIPDNFQKIDDENGYAIIVRKGEPITTAESRANEDSNDIDVENLPF